MFCEISFVATFCWLTAAVIEAVKLSILPMISVIAPTLSTAWRVAAWTSAICPEICMTWDELRTFADDPLVTIGAHTISHCNLAKQTQETASHEMTDSRARIENVLQRRVLHFAYPYGDRISAGAREFALARSAGFKTAVTTRPGMIFSESAEHLMALPRVSLNGNYQDERILPVLTSGAATALWNGFRRVDAA